METDHLRSKALDVPNALQTPQPWAGEFSSIAFDCGPYTRSALAATAVCFLSLSWWLASHGHRSRPYHSAPCANHALRLGILHMLQHLVPTVQHDLPHVHIGLPPRFL